MAEAETRRTLPLRAIRIAAWPAEIVIGAGSRTRAHETHGPAAVLASELSATTPAPVAAATDTFRTPSTRGNTPGDPFEVHPSRVLAMADAVEAVPRIAVWSDYI